MGGGIPLQTKVKGGIGAWRGFYPTKLFGCAFSLSLGEINPFYIISRKKGWGKQGKGVPPKGEENIFYPRGAFGPKVVPAVLLTRRDLEGKPYPKSGGAVSKKVEVTHPGGRNIGRA